LAIRPVLKTGGPRGLVGSSPTPSAYIISLAWTEPTSTPPYGNISAPINVSNQGQIKYGGLLLNFGKGPNLGGATTGLIVANGNVGIGTTSPDAALHVEGDVKIGGFINQPSYNLVLGSGDTDYYDQDWEGPFDSNPGDTCNNNPDSQYMCPPSETKSCTDVISGTNPDTGLTAYWKRNVVCVIDSYVYRIRNNFGSVQFLNASNTPTFVLTQSGNVGIGTMAPGQKLDVAGGYIRSDTGFCIGTNCITSWPSAGSGTTNYIAKWTGSTTLGNSIIYDNGTNVGIGTTNPNAKLDVNGEIRFWLNGIQFKPIFINLGEDYYQDWHDYDTSPGKDSCDGNAVSMYYCKVDENKGCVDIARLEDYNAEGLPYYYYGSRQVQCYQAVIFRSVY
jgi:hypothetical protein